MSVSSRIRAGRHRGVATIEFAICAPLLLVLMLATAEIGRVLFQYNTLAKAVRDGVRYTVREAASGSTGTVAITPQVRDNTRNLVVTGTISGSGSPLLRGLTTANVTVSSAGAGFVSVSATYTYVPMLGATLPMLGIADPINMQLPLTATVVMRALL
jgi:Flp pilus assembly protein TadG